jgi:hypothetical protein
MLIHPLAAAAGGDRFHAGGKHWKSKSDPEWQTLAAWVRGNTLTSGGATARGVVRVLQSNSAGDDIHVIDPATNQIVGKIEGIEVPHGLVIARRWAANLCHQRIVAHTGRHRFEDAKGRQAHSPERTA